VTGHLRTSQEAADTSAVVTVTALLSVATVAGLLDCSPRTVRRRIAEGSLPAVLDHGRVMVRGDELRGYIDRLGRVGATEARNMRNMRDARPAARDDGFLRD
jgi:excisionase family DNA binding protein